MANRCKNGPAAASALDVGESAGFNRVPLVYAACSLACDVAAADAGEYFVDCVHSSYLIL